MLRIEKNKSRKIVVRMLEFNSIPQRDDPSRLSWMFAFDYAVRYLHGAQRDRE
jgi:hypothetical protein